MILLRSAAELALVTDGGAAASADTLVTWTRIVNALGVPITILLVVGLALWRSARWAAPRLDALFQEQLQFVRSTNRMVENLGREMKSLKGSADANTAAVRELAEEIRAQRKERKAS